MSRAEPSRAEPWGVAVADVNPKEQLREYERMMGKEASERQQRLAAERCHKCGAILPNHSPLCRENRRP